MVSLPEVLKGYRVVELSHVLEEGMPRPQMPHGELTKITLYPLHRMLGLTGATEAYLKKNRDEPSTV